MQLKVSNLMSSANINLMSNLMPFPVLGVPSTVKCSQCTKLNPYKQWINQPGLCPGIRSGLASKALTLSVGNYETFCEVFKQADILKYTRPNLIHRLDPYTELGILKSCYITCTIT